jgi:regulator of sigma E protease
MPELTGYWSLLYQLPIGIIGLSFMVFVHELGHFLAAKKMGVRVHTFSIGFGKKLIRVKRGDTEYCLSLIPFGGYVAMAGENPDEGGYGNTDEFQSKSVPARIFIAVAGPAANILFALALLFGLYLSGVQEPKPGLTVGHVEEKSAGARAGVLPGDEILAFAGKPMRDWEQFVQEAALSGDKPQPLQIRRSAVGTEVARDTTVSLSPEMNPKFGVALTGILGEWEVSIHKVMPGRAADQAGLKAGDVIERVDGTPIPSATALVEMINGSKGRALALSVRRNDNPVELSVTPAYDADLKRWMIGIQPAGIVPTMLVRRGVVASAQQAAATTWKHATLVFRTFGSLFTGDVHMKALSGPIGIVQMISGSLQQSTQKFIEFTALLNTNLGVLNLLPLAITDGGLILLLLIEAVRRKPVSPRIQGAINRVGVAFFVTVFLFITFQDILRIPMFLD